jgi:hypothetical protein
VDFSDDRALRKWVLEQQRVMTCGIPLLERLMAAGEKNQDKNMPALRASTKRFCSHGRAGSF